MNDTLKDILTIAFILVLVAIWVFIFTADSQNDEASSRKIETMAMMQGNTLIGIASSVYPKAKIMAVVTAYSPKEGCDDPDCITASGEIVKEGMIACPRELKFGTKIKIQDEIYECKDRMAKKYNDRFDIFFSSYESAMEWGIKEETIEIF